MTIDVAVLEVGMGGRWDATNAVDPALAAITTVHYDHQAVLGDTLAAIAAEKAGISRRGVPLVSGVREPEARQTIERHCKTMNAPFIDATVVANVPQPQVLLGDHQRQNAAVAYALLREWQNREPLLTDTAIVEGIQGARNPGRLEQLLDDPPVFLDGAHNREGLRALKQFVQKRFPDRKVRCLFSVMKDKNYAAMAQDLAEWVSAIYFVPLSESRALTYAEFAKESEAPCEPLPLTAITPQWFAIEDRDAVWVICGSLYLVGAVTKSFCV